MNHANESHAVTTSYDPLKDGHDEEVSRAADVLGTLCELDKPDEPPVTVEEITTCLNYRGWEARMRGLGQLLNDLRRAGYIRRVHSNEVVGYRVTTKGWAAP